MESLIAFVTGVSGAGRLPLLREIQAINPSFRIIDIGSRMYKKSDDLGISIPDGKILDMDPLALDYLRAATFEDVLREAELIRTQRDVGAISTHVCFRWKKHLISAFNFHYVNTLNPDVYINVLDNVHNIYVNLQHDKAWRDRLTLKEILIWRDEEAFITRMLAEYQKKPFYLFPRREDPHMLERILFKVERAKRAGEKPMPKAYLSYPITHVKGSPEVMKAKDETKQKLKDAGIVVFDPISIEDSILIDMAHDAASKGKDKVEVEVDGKRGEINIHEIMSAVGDIKDQIVVRDYQLINQSDIIVVFYPTRMLSPGVLSEIKYGYTHNKEVYAIFPFEEASPFFEYYTTKLFKDVDSLLDYLQEAEKL
ncbi:MAG: hypothetical protein ACP5II_06610 [Infirmifilum sp.]|jgi:adenylate kinase|uniref:Uncharacterized protein n=2 Tax=Infirmifilum TaxID=2856573 RepID=A0A0F7CL89_9CREN|nr:hypothetical protein [Infirmifilum uzonense]AKG38991.1 hypothetical protein MA03_06675 [Infirmifilum uzonense]